MRSLGRGRGVQGQKASTGVQGGCRGRRGVQGYTEERQAYDGRCQGTMWVCAGIMGRSAGGRGDIKLARAR